MFAAFLGSICLGIGWVSGFGTHEIRARWAGRIPGFSVERILENSAETRDSCVREFEACERIRRTADAEAARTALSSARWTCPELLEESGNIACSRGMEDIACESWKSLLESHPETPAARRAVGALAAFRRDAPLGAKDKILAALWLAERGDFPRALSFLDESGDEFLHNRIKILNQAGKHREAIDCGRLFLRIHEGSPRLDRVLLNLAHNLRTHDRAFSESAAVYREFLRRFPEAPNAAGARVALGDCLLAENDIAGAFESYALASRQAGQRELRQAAEYSAATACSLAQKGGAAIEWLEKASAHPPGKTTDMALWKLAEMHSRAGRGEKAGAALDRLLRESRSPEMREKAARLRQRDSE